MTKNIIPPRKIGERSRAVATVTIYKETVDALRSLVERKNTNRAEYLRWLVECAEAGLVGPTLRANFAQASADLVVALLDGQMTFIEGDAALELLINHACQDTRAAVEAEWSGENDSD